ncbi:MAG: hypothetical protein ACKO7N_07270 [Candidatus Nitrosotenuis sp.]
MVLSIIEFAVYGFVAYSSILMLIISTIRTAELGKALSIIRAIYMIPGVICSSVLANAGVEITMPSQTSVLIANSGNMTETISSSITLVNPAWITLHYLFMAILIIYVISQMIILFTKIE